MSIKSHQIYKPLIQIQIAKKIEKNIFNHKRTMRLSKWSYIFYVQPGPKLDQDNNLGIDVLATNPVHMTYLEIDLCMNQLIKCLHIIYSISLNLYVRPQYI